MYHQIEAKAGARAKLESNIHSKAESEPNLNYASSPALVILKMTEIIKRIFEKSKIEVV